MTVYTLEIIDENLDSYRIVGVYSDITLAQKVARQYTQHCRIEIHEVVTSL